MFDENQPTSKQSGNFPVDTHIKNMKGFYKKKKKGLGGGVEGWRMREADGLEKPSHMEQRF